MSQRKNEKKGAIRMPFEQEQQLLNQTESETQAPNSVTPAFIYEKCITCPDIGHTCNGPNMLILPIDQVRKIIRRRKQHLGITADLLAAKSGVPKGTVSRFLSGDELDFKYTTVSAVANALVAMSGDRLEVRDNPCPATSTELKARDAENSLRLAESEARCAQLLEELAAEKEKQITAVNDVRTEELRKSEYLEALAAQRLQIIERKERKINAMGIAIGILLAAMVAMALVL